MSCRLSFALYWDPRAVLRYHESRFHRRNARRFPAAELAAIAYSASKSFSKRAMIMKAGFLQICLFSGMIPLGMLFALGYAARVMERCISGITNMMLRGCLRWAWM